ncbi:hypothetical protein EV363DRAFT_1149766 [Boletus edulis]|nr:hypothetical protein EV363DRAFT_1149766 [Boletus edulis]
MSLKVQTSKGNYLTMLSVRIEHVEFFDEASTSSRLPPGKMSTGSIDLPFSRSVQQCETRTIVLLRTGQLHDAER